jgi:hypothetical protein
MRTFAIGDPQAPFDTFLAILDRHGLRAPHGKLRDDVRLISMGDHFDWGKPADRSRAARDAMSLVAWLTSHPPEQVVMIAGNHDLARVGELWGIHDDEFARAQAVADRAYIAKDAGADAEFHREWPRFTTAEVVSRDLSTYKSEQSDVVAALLSSKRLRLAYVERDLLFVHAGVTTHETKATGADAIAAELNAALDAFSEARPLVIPGLHMPGDSDVEGLGMLYHRPSRGLTDEEKRELARSPMRRRFDPLTIPVGVKQVIGHIRDSKCRRLMSDIADNAPNTDGVLRSLVVDGANARYQHGLETGAASIWFTDGGMSSCPVDKYEILDVERFEPAQSR